MEVKLEKRYPLDVDPQRAWTILSDLAAVARCMPGAELTEQLSETSYKGAVKVKVGPAVAQFGGTVSVQDRDDAARRMVLQGKGADKGGSSASMDMTAVVEADPANPDHAVLVGDAAVIVNGKFAQFGGRMMTQVSDLILQQFVENFRLAAHALPTAHSTTAQAATAHDAPPGPAVAASSDTPAAPVARELNGLAIAWALVCNWWRGLFGKRS